MIDGIVEIGKSVLQTLKNEAVELPSALAIEVPEKIHNVKQHIVILKLKTSPPKLDFDFREIQEDTAEEFLWLGNAPTAMLPQDRLTTDNLSYLVSQTVPNLVERLVGGELKNTLQQICDKFYFDLGEKSVVGAKDGQYERYRLLWDPNKLGYSNLSVKEIRDKVQETNSAKSAIKLIVESVMDAIQQNTGLKKKDIRLFTVEANGQILVQHPDYKSYLFRSLISKIFEEAKEGVCHLCNNRKKVTWDTTRLKFKFYMTDKIGFASQLGGNKGFLKNYAFCENCYKALLIAEPFIRNRLRSSLANSNVYIIPSFQLENVVPSRELEKWSEYVTTSFNAALSLEGWREFQGELEEFQEHEARKSGFMLNFLFWQKQQAEFKVLRLIQDVPPSRLDKLQETSNIVKDLASKLLAEDNNWYLGLKDLYSLFPVRRIRRDNRIEWENKKVLEFYGSLFSGRSISYSFLIKEFVDLAKVYRFEQFDQFSTRRTDNSDIDLVYALLKANLLLLYLQKLNILRGRPAMEIKTELLDQAMGAFVKEMGYSEPQISLFLLGCLIGEIGSAQRSRENPTKPILNKITYQGMNKGKILRLTNEVFEKLKQYKSGKKPLLAFSEGTFAEMKRLLDRNFKNWSLSDQENVFYILSGYAYNTYRAIQGGKAKVEEEGGENNG